MCICEIIRRRSVIRGKRKRMILLTNNNKRKDKFTLSAAKDEPFCSFCIKVTFVCLSGFFFYKIYIYLEIYIYINYSY